MLVFFFIPNVMTNSIIKKLTNLQIFGFFYRPPPPKKITIFRDENLFVADCGLMAKSQFLLNSMRYFSNKLQKSKSHFSRIFFNISKNAWHKSYSIESWELNLWFGSSGQKYMDPDPPQMDQASERQNAHEENKKEKNIFCWLELRGVCISAEYFF